MSEPEDPEAKVLAFTPPKGPVTLRKTRPHEDWGERECQHNNVRIRERPRRLRCEDCRAAVDPFEYLLGLAERWERLFPKNEAARQLETALASTLEAHGSISISEGGVTARRLTEQGAKLEAHESWSSCTWTGGVASAIVAAVRKLDIDAARWGGREVVYPRWTVEKVRGEKRFRVGVLARQGSWGLIAEVESLSSAYALVKDEAARVSAPPVVEDRPRKLWR